MQSVDQCYKKRQKCWQIIFTILGNIGKYRAKIENIGKILGNVRKILEKYWGIIKKILGNIGVRQISIGLEFFRVFQSSKTTLFIF